MSAPYCAQPPTARDVSVVIPVHRGGDALRRCLEHLAAAEPRAGEVIVVADGPGDGAWQVAERYGARVVELPQRVGAGAARNAGARAARGSVLFFVDADVTVAPDAVGRVVASLAAHPEWSAVFGSYDDAPGPPNFVAQYKGLLNHYVHQRAREEAFTFWTALGAVRRDAFQGAGGFDPSCVIEDVELGYRLRAGGRRVGVDKALLGKHLKPWTFASLLRSDFLHRAIPWTQVMLRYGSAERDLNLDTASRRSVVASFLLVAAVLTSLAWSAAAGLVAAGACAAALLWLNRSLYAFFGRKRGPWFAARAVAMHWLYFLYGGAAFAVGVAQHLAGYGAGVALTGGGAGASALAPAVVPGPEVAA